MRNIQTPISNEVVQGLHVGEMIRITGKIYCGRDAVLPRICKLIEDRKLEQYGIELEGSVIFHTAVSAAGVGPTSSNKVEIESSFPMLSQAGVKMHLGKGAIGRKTIELLNQYHSVYAVMPPVTALLEKNTLSRRVVAFPELGMEAFYEIEVREYPAIVAAAHDESIY
ncbi:MAG: fumarate hydratase C-terminal domain-containing protein [bacterium]|nr:fumarate hydratase C-terminal domain-containing protein [bacterium]MCM1374643.1 fumarate hydratase C-terminal domain-containing protein [Muribaculum sp.]